MIPESRNSGMSALRPAPWLWVLLLVLGIVGAFPGSHAVRPLDSHEIFVAQTAEEMIQRKNFLVPTFNGELRLQKPPLSYWTAVVSERFGDGQFPHLSEFEARLPSAFAAIALMFVTAGMGAVAFGDWRVGWGAAALLATTWGFEIFSHSARPEMLYAFFCSLEMLGFLWLQQTQEQPRTNFLAGLLAWGGFAGAVLTKGPLFPLFILVGVLVAWLIRNPRPLFVPSVRPVMGLTFALVSGVYFVYLASQANGAGGFWVDQMTQSTQVPVWIRPLRLYFVFATLKLLLPWTLFLLLAAKEIWKNRHPCALTLVLGALSCLIFVSFSGKLRLHYMLPAIPFLCVLMAWAGVVVFDGFWNSKVGQIRMRQFLEGHIGGLTTIAIGLILLAFRAAPYSGVNPWVSVVPWMAFSVIAGGTAWIFFHRSKPVRAFMCLILMASLMSAGMGFGALGFRTKWFLTTDFTDHVRKVAPPDLPLFAHPDLVPYLLYYGGLHPKPISSRDLPTIAAHQHAPALVVYDQDRLEKSGLKGHILYQGRVTKSGKSVVLFQTDGEEPIRASAPTG